MNFSFRNGLAVLTLFVGFVCSSNCFANRIVIKNPRVPPLFEKMIDKIKLGKNVYWIIENQKGHHFVSKFQSYADQLKQYTNADSVYEDIEIKLVNDEPEVETDVTDVQINSWHVKKLKYDTLPKEYDGRGVIVAVIDTGVDIKHLALNGKIWQNESEIPGNEIDDDGNGYIDDYNGYDFFYNISEPRDNHSHGTHCAGIIAGKPELNTGAEGIAQGVKIMPLKIMEPGYSNNKAHLSDAIRAIKYAVDNGAKVISNSWGSTQKSDYKFEKLALFKEAVDYAHSKGAVVVFAAANDGLDLSIAHENVMVPIEFAKELNIVTVGSSDEQDSRSTFSNYGMPFVSVFAPGSNIYSTIPNNRMELKSGTSMATPMVAGLIARGLSKGMSPERVVAKLKETAEELPAFSDISVYGGIINPVKFLE